MGGRWTCSSPEDLFHGWRRSVRGNAVEVLAVPAVEQAESRITESNGARHDRVEYRLRVIRRARDHAQDICRGRLLLLSFRLALQRLRQALLQVTNPGVVLRRLAGNRKLGFLGLGGLRTPTH